MYALLENSLIIDKLRDGVLDVDQDKTPVSFLNNPNFTVEAKQNVFDELNTQVDATLASHGQCIESC